MVYNNNKQTMKEILFLPSWENQPQAELVLNYQKGHLLDGLKESLNTLEKQPTAHQPYPVPLVGLFFYCQSLFMNSCVYVFVYIRLNLLLFLQLQQQLLSATSVSSSVLGTLYTSPSLTEEKRMMDWESACSDHKSRGKSLYISILSLQNRKSSL